MIRVRIIEDNPGARVELKESTTEQRADDLVNLKHATWCNSSTDLKVLGSETKVACSRRPFERHQDSIET